MFTVRSFMSLAILCMIAVPASAKDSDVQKLKKFVLKKASEHRTMTADVSIEMTIINGNDVTEAIGRGTLAMANSGKDTNVRLDVKLLYDGDPEGEKGTIKQDLSVFVNSQNTAILYGGDKNPVAAEKRETDMRSVYDASTFFRVLDLDKHQVTFSKVRDRKKNKFILLSVEPPTKERMKRRSLKDKDKNKKEAKPEPYVRDEFFFNEEGSLVKHIRYDESDEPIETVKISNIKYDAPVNAKKLVFTAPEGIKVNDTTREGLKEKELEERRKKITDKQKKASK